MAEDNKLIPRENGFNGAVDVVPLSSRLPVWDLSPHEPHLYDYLLVLRKHQWLVPSFQIPGVTHLSLGHFPLHPLYVATPPIRNLPENSYLFPFTGSVLLP